jgi:hypothetical protein
MATDYWTDGTANWDTPSDWSAGLPDATSDVEIDQGNPEVTTSFGTVNQIVNTAALTFIDAGASTITGDLQNYHFYSYSALILDPFSGDGGSSLTIGGYLYNYLGTFQIGPSDNTLSAASTVQAAGLASSGEVDLYGSSTAQATLDLAAVPYGFGTVNLSGDALLEFNSGQMTVIVKHSKLSLTGPGAFVADASDTSSNSALTGLMHNYGELDLEDGASVTTSSAWLVNRGVFALDAGSGDGGSSLTIGGKLHNQGKLQIGPSDSTLSTGSTVRAAHLSNVRYYYSSAYPTIDLYGSSIAEATLDVGSAAGFGAGGVLYSNVNLSGDALIEFRSGQITTIAANSALSLIGSHAFVANASDTSFNSALKGLNTVVGGFQLEDGATVTTSRPLTNSGAITLDGNPDDGGSVLTVNGALTNTGTISIGPSDNTLSASSILDAAKIVNDGAIGLIGGKAADATLRCGGPFTNDGSVNLSHDTETIGGAVGGTGDFGLSTSTLEFVNSVSSGQAVTFKSGAGPNHLYLDSPSAFNGTIGTFSKPGDSVVAKGFTEAATTLAYSQGTDSCSWTLTDSTHTAVINFAGAPYAQSDFAISASVNGNTLIKFV